MKEGRPGAAAPAKSHNAEAPLPPQRPQVGDSIPLSKEYADPLAHHHPPLVPAGDVPSHGNTGPRAAPVAWPTPMMLPSHVVGPSFPHDAHRPYYAYNTYGEQGHLLRRDLPPLRDARGHSGHAVLPPPPSVGLLGGAPGAISSIRGLLHEPGGGRPVLPQPSSAEAAYLQDLYREALARLDQADAWIAWLESRLDREERALRACKCGAAAALLEEYSRPSAAFSREGEPPSTWPTTAPNFGPPRPFIIHSPRDPAQLSRESAPPQGSATARAVAFASAPSTESAASAREGDSVALQDAGVAGARQILPHNTMSTPSSATGSLSVVTLPKTKRRRRTFAELDESQMRRFRCPVNQCGRMYALENSLKQHMRSKHGYTPEEAVSAVSVQVLSLGASGGEVPDTDKGEEVALRPVADSVGGSESTASVAPSVAPSVASERDPDAVRGLELKSFS
eukprot:Opistho-1_new@61143